MNLTKFLFIDAALVLAVIPILLLLPIKNKKSSLFGKKDKNKLIEKTYIKLPDKEKLLELEKLASNKGSGIEFNELFGDWKFVKVWREDIKTIDSLFSELLRLFSAKLSLEKNISTTGNI